MVLQSIEAHWDATLDNLVALMGWQSHALYVPINILHVFQWYNYTIVAISSALPAFRQRKNLARETSLAFASQIF